jgi:hypothetical protein
MTRIAIETLRKGQHAIMIMCGFVTAADHVFQIASHWLWT